MHNVTRSRAALSALLIRAERPSAIIWSGSRRNDYARHRAVQHRQQRHARPIVGRGNTDFGVYVGTTGNLGTLNNNRGGLILGDNVAVGVDRGGTISVLTNSGTIGGNSNSRDRHGVAARSVRVDQQRRDRPAQWRGRGHSQSRRHHRQPDQHQQRLDHRPYTGRVRNSGFIGGIANTGVLHGVNNEGVIASAGVAQDLQHRAAWQYLQLRNDRRQYFEYRRRSVYRRQSRHADRLRRRHTGYDYQHQR